LRQGDPIVQWLKPTKPRAMERDRYQALPACLLVREARVQVEQPGFRTETLILATTWLGAEDIPEGDRAQLDRARGNAELELRSLKQTRQMAVLRCPTPELVRPELGAHILADNLIRTLIAHQLFASRGERPRVAWSCVNHHRLSELLAIPDVP